MTKRKLLACIAAVAVCLLGKVPSAYAGAIQLNDLSDMSPGTTFAPFPLGAPGNPLTFTAGAINLTYSTEGFLGFTLDDGSGFAFPSGMTPILLNNQPTNGPITIEFSTGIQEFGFFAQNAASDIEKFTFNVFGPTSLLNTFFVGPANNTVPPAGVALFLGARATDTDVITRLVVSSTSSEGFDNFFAVGPMTFVPAADQVPEPASLLLLGTGLLGVGVRLRRRRMSA